MLKTLGLESLGFPRRPVDSVGMKEEIGAGVEGAGVIELDQDRNPTIGFTFVLEPVQCRKVGGGNVEVENAGDGALRGPAQQCRVDLVADPDPDEPRIVAARAW